MPSTAEIERRFIRILTDCGPANSTLSDYEWKSKDPVVSQSTRLDVTVALQYVLGSQRSRLYWQEGMDLLAR